MRFKLKVFETFLRNIDLAAYREKYQHIKTVEMDLPKPMQPLKTIYRIYWDKGGKKYEKPPEFDEFYKQYCKDCGSEFKEFKEKNGYGKRCKCFEIGLKARIYRTWASIITQIHAGYVAEQVFGDGSVEQSEELDHKNIDFKITTESKVVKIQIKKQTMRREIARMHNQGLNDTDIHEIYYIVPPDFNKPCYERNTKNNRVGDYKDWAHMFVGYFPAEGTLDRFENGFVVFTKAVFEDFK